ncbi:MAG: triose-phosphate isomerase [Alphaproteobacteria bacterium]
MTQIRPLIAGNWKMNGVKASLAEIAKLRLAVENDNLAAKADIMICPPTTLVSLFAEALKGSAITIGAQNCHKLVSGAYTGEVSAPMLADAGATAVILGHSERRSQAGERDCDVRDKAVATHTAGLTAIICVGETAGERQMGLTLQVIARQLAGSLPENVSGANTVIAYEPVWAIGTGLTPSIADVAEVHRFMRAELTKLRGEAAANEIRLLYGGSVSAKNAAELLAVTDVNGGLVGGASLKAEDFAPIAAACPA